VTSHRSSSFQIASCLIAPLSMHGKRYYYLSRCYPQILRAYGGEARISRNRKPLHNASCLPNTGVSCPAKMTYGGMNPELWLVVFRDFRGVQKHASSSRYTPLFIRLFISSFYNHHNPAQSLFVSSRNHASRLIRVQLVFTNRSINRSSRTLSSLPRRPTIVLNCQDGLPGSPRSLLCCERYGSSPF